MKKKGSKATISLSGTPDQPLQKSNGKGEQETANDSNNKPVTDIQNMASVLGKRKAETQI